MCSGTVTSASMQQYGSAHGSTKSLVRLKGKGRAVRGLRHPERPQPSDTDHSPSPAKHFEQNRRTNEMRTCVDGEEHMKRFQFWEQPGVLAQLREYGIHTDNGQRFKLSSFSSTREGAACRQSIKVSVLVSMRDIANEWSRKEDRDTKERNGEISHERSQAWLPNKYTDWSVRFSKAGVFRESIVVMGMISASLINIPARANDSRWSNGRMKVATPLHITSNVPLMRFGALVRISRHEERGTSPVKIMKSGGSEGLRQTMSNFSSKGYSPFADPSPGSNNFATSAPRSMSTFIHCGDTGSSARVLSNGRTAFGGGFCPPESLIDRDMGSFRALESPDPWYSSTNAVAPTASCISTTNEFQRFGTGSLHGRHTPQKTRGAVARSGVTKSTSDGKQWTNISANISSGKASRGPSANLKDMVMEVRCKMQSDLMVTSPNLLGFVLVSGLSAKIFVKFSPRTSLFF
ncbi:hypothetical protein DFH06DRAFT_1119090 [Mycena polygramma]|nr:hypothetical protein DFH06DRAFT_1119090 [Mycena polygramma]